MVHTKMFRMESMYVLAYLPTFLQVADAMCDKSGAPTEMCPVRLPGIWDFFLGTWKFNFWFYM